MFYILYSQSLDFNEFFMLVKGINKKQKCKMFFSEKQISFKVVLWKKMEIDKCLLRINKYKLFKSYNKKIVNNI